MHRKITRFARAGKCGRLAASARVVKPENASQPKPSAEDRRSWRLERIFSSMAAQWSVEVAEFRAGKQRAAEAGPCRFVIADIRFRQELARRPQFIGKRRAG